jgi:pyrimidine operon attenuation protein/uracil phosphoribosyltransferase
VHEIFRPGKLGRSMLRPYTTEPRHRTGRAVEVQDKKARLRQLLEGSWLFGEVVGYVRITPDMKIVEKAQLMSASEIDRTLQRVAHEIVEKSGGTKDLALIGIRRRGVPLAQRIARAMRGIDGVDVPVGTLDITLYRDDLSKVASHAVMKSSDISFGVDNMNLVLVDDVLYTGRTIRAAMNGLFDLGRPKRVSLCVLIDRGWREMPIEAQFTGRVVQTSATEIIEVRLREIDNEERVVLVDRVD